jgi:enoyl-[acyl-carrier protein] reductase I
MSSLNGLLAGKVGLVTGIANERSIAAGCAQAFRDSGAELVPPWQ